MDDVAPETLRAWDDAHVTPRAWLYRKLLALAARLGAGASASVPDTAGTVLRTPDDLAGWVRGRYPEFADDALHPAFRASGAPAMGPGTAGGGA